MRIYGILILLVNLNSCANIEQSNEIVQTTNSEFTVGIGDSIYSATTVKSLPNVFGKADLFGRTTPTGKIDLIFNGVENGYVNLIRNSVGIETFATTMNSTPIVVSNTQTTTYSGVVSGEIYSGTATTNAPPTVLPASQPAPLFSGQKTLPISIPLEDLPQIIVVNQAKITIITADKYMASVKIEE